MENKNQTMDTKSLTDSTKFFSLVKKYGWKRLLISVDTISAFLLLVTLIIDKESGKILAISTDSSIVAIIAVASTLFAITLAALAIILSFSTSDFVSFLKKHNKLSTILFNFWLGNTAYLIVILLCFCYLLLGDTFNDVKQWIYPFIASIFLYSLIETFYLLATIVRFGYFIDLLGSVKESGEK